MQDQQFNDNELKYVSVIREECTSVIEDEVDLSEAFELVYSRDISETDVENYIRGLIFQLFETSSKPLQIHITKENVPHVVRSNINLKGLQKIRHRSALIEIDRIIRNARNTYREGKVDVSHNTRKQTLAHKAKVKEYIYFETHVKIYDSHFLVELASEQMFGQEEDILDLYNVRVKRDPTAAHLSTLQTGVINNLPSDN